MTSFFIGAKLDRAPGPRYSAALSFAEIALRDPLPRIATLSKWRDGLPENFRLSIVAPRKAIWGANGPLRPDDASREATAWWTGAAQALSAHALVLPTPSELTTGQRDRDFFARFVESLQAESRTIVWAPTGLWEWSQAYAFAQRLGIVCAFDPLESPVPEGPTLYARITAVGKRTRFTPAILERVANAVTSEDDVETAYVAVESMRSFEEAVQLQGLVGALGAHEGEPVDDQDDLDGENDLDDDDDGFEDDEE